jgi:hypothetical protein
MWEERIHGSEVARFRDSLSSSRYHGLRNLLGRWVVIPYRKNSRLLFVPALVAVTAAGSVHTTIQKRWRYAVDLERVAAPLR